MCGKRKGEAGRVFDEFGLWAMQASKTHAYVVLLACFAVFCLRINAALSFSKDGHEV